MSRITIAQLEAFFWTASFGSMERASTHLHISQPSISLRVRALEEQLGFKLFERAGRGLRLSLRGQTLLPQARRAIEEVQAIEQHKDAGTIKGRIRLGFAEGFALVCLGEVVERLRAAYPDLHPELVIETSPQLEQKLHANKLDLVFLVGPAGHADYALYSLGRQELAWVASRRWKLPATVTPADLAALPLITSPAPSVGFQRTTSWFESAGIHPLHLDTCTSIAGMAHLIEASASIGILATKMVERGIADGSLMQLASVPPISPVEAFAEYRHDRSPSTMSAIIQIVEDIAKSIGFLH